MTTLNQELRCHLELAVTNSLWGFSVYLQEIALGQWILVDNDHVTSILASDWSKLIM